MDDGKTIQKAVATKGEVSPDVWPSEGSFLGEVG